VPLIFGEGSNGDPKRTFGRFLLAVRHRDHHTLEQLGSRFCEWETGGQKAALSTQTGTQGGYTVPTEFYNRLMALVAEMAIVRPRATLVPMAARTVQVPVLDVATAPAAGDTAFLGGVVARWTEEATTLNETEPTFKQVELTNYELSGYSKLSNTLLQDSAIGLEAFLFQLFSRAIAWYEDYAFLRGNGVAKPLGVLNWSGLISVTRSASGAFTLTDMANMFGRLLPGYTPRSAAWVVHPTVVPKLLQIASTAAAGQNLFLNNAQERPRMQLLGLDIHVSEKLPALNTLGDVLLCDFQHYLIGDRQQLEIAYSEHVAFLSNQSVWRFCSRIGGQPWLRDKVTLSDGSSTLSPFVGLATG
jgi:HK97 family phage major capsid protein